MLGLGVNLFGIARLMGSAVPAPLPITVISGGVLSRSGSTVTWEPWTYSVAGLDVDETVFDLNGEEQPIGSITFPYTLAAGGTLTARGYAAKAGYNPALPTSATVETPPGATTVGIIGNRFAVPTALLTTTIVNGFTSRRHHYAHPDGDVTNLQCVDVHWYIASFPTAAPTSRQQKRYIEYPAGVFHQVRWAGAGSLTLTSGSYKSDIVISSVTGTPLVIPAGAMFWERTVNIGAGMAANTMPIIVLPAATNTLGALDGNSATDLGNSGTIAVTTTANSFGSAAIVGNIAVANARSFVMMGDSIVYGQGDVSSVGPKGGSGWVARMLDVHGYPYTKIADMGQTAAEALLGGSLFPDFMAMVPCSEVISEHGINDIRTGSTQATLLANLQSIYAMFPGKVINQTTMTPRSDTTDAYATTANQTPKTDGNMAALSAINAAIRVPQSGVTRVLEAADAAMSARDTNIWKAPPASTLDGTHPTSAACAAMAAEVAPSLEVVPGPVITPIATTSLSTYAFDGETFTWDTPIPVGQYVGGEPFAITNSAISITAMGTPSAGAGNGAMVNPRIDSPLNQGFDPLLASNTRQSVPYARDIDPTAAGAPYAIAANGEATIVKSRRKAGAVAGSWQTIEKYLPFTFLPASKAPVVGDFRPGMCSTDKVSRLNINTLDFGCCRSLDLTGMGYPSVATLLARWRRAQPWFCRGADHMRVLNVLTNFTSSNYMADIAELLIGDTGAVLNSNISDAEKTLLAIEIGHVAGDIAAQWDVGHPGGAGAGQQEFFGPVLLWAAALFNSTYMFNAFHSLMSNVDQVYWCDTSNVGRATEWPAGNESGEFQFVIPYCAEDLGKPVWGGADGGFPFKASHGGQLNRSYGNIGGSGRARLDSWLPVALILANRSMPNGVDLIKGGAAMPEDNTAHRSAMVHKLDIDYTHYPTSNMGMSSKSRALYAAYRALVPATKLAQVPDTPYYSNFTPGTNAINWNYAAEVAANAFSSTPITALNLWISQDNVQFTEVPAVPNSGSRAAPGGIKHYCAVALQNAQGKGRRSYTVKNFASDADVRGAVTPIGTPTGAVVCDTLPKIMVREYPENENINWYVDPVGAVAPGTLLYFGTGLWSGAISGAATVQLQREATMSANDWGNIAGVSPYEMVAGDVDHRMRLAVTRNGVTAYSLPITVGTLAALPAGVLIDTDFGADFKLRHPAFWASLQAEAGVGTLVHEPDRSWGAIGTAPGGIRKIKAGSFPSIPGAIAGLTIGTVYRLTADLPVEADAVPWSASGLFRLGTTKGGIEYGAARTIAYNATTGAQPSLVQIDWTFTATTTTLWIHSNVNTATGSTAGGNPVMSKLKLEVV